MSNRAATNLGNSASKILPTRIVSIGPLDWRSGYEHGMMAIQLLVKKGYAITWDIWGIGNYYLALDWAIRDLDLRNYVFIKRPFEQTNKDRILRSCDIYFWPGIDGTNTDGLIDAVSLKKRIVSTVKQIQMDLIPNEEEDPNYITVPVRDWRKMASALEKYCTITSSQSETHLTHSQIAPREVQEITSRTSRIIQNTKLRVAIINYRFPSRGNPYIWEWIRSLSTLGLDITIIAEGIDDPYSQFRSSDLLRRLQLLNTLRSAPDNSLSPTRIFQRNIPAMVKSFFRPQRLAAGLFKLRFEPKLLTSIRKSYEYLPILNETFDVIHFNTPGIALRRIELGSLFAAKTLVSFRGQDIDSYPDKFKVLFSKVDHIHFISEHLLRQAKKLGYSRQNYTIIPPMINLNFYAPKSTEKEDEKKLTSSFILFTAATLTWRKGHEYALQAVALLIERGFPISYFIAGEGDFKEALIHTIQQLKIESSVHLLGWLTPEQVLNWLQRADIYLLVSVDEAFNNSVLQAQACAVPVVCSDAGGLPENIEDNVTGMLTQRRDAWDTANKVELLLTDLNRRKTMGRAGRSRASEKFSIEQGTQEFIDLYNQMVQ